MRNVLRVLGAVWLLPAAVVMWAFYLLPIWALGWVRMERSPRFLVAQFRVTPGASWYHRAWRKWAGFSMPFAVILSPRTLNGSVVKHELRHTDQWLLFGPLFPALYLLSLAIWGYRNSPFERDARGHE